MQIKQKTLRHWVKFCPINQSIIIGVLTSQIRCDAKGKVATGRSFLLGSNDQLYCFEDSLVASISVFFFQATNGILCSSLNPISGQSNSLAERILQHGKALSECFFNRKAVSVKSDFGHAHHSKIWPSTPSIFRIVLTCKRNGGGPGVRGARHRSKRS